MMRVTVTLKKLTGNEIVIVTAKDELDFTRKISILLKERGATGFSRVNTVKMEIVR